MNGHHYDRNNPPPWYRFTVLAGGLAVAVTALFTFMRSVVTIPDQIDRHAQEITVLHRQNDELSKELKSQREILIEMRTDLKYIKNSELHK
ncbi:MAG TPA: hypothetical protein PKJ00_03485 [Verrucomicrobiota bacterium]|nr:hypothetical protein [Verrucomicrobiota bacterium]HNS68991.1 hypothetical protein [Verrucomicrobiota bacterium]